MEKLRYQVYLKNFPLSKDDKWEWFIDSGYTNIYPAMQRCLDHAKFYHTKIVDMAEGREICSESGEVYNGGI